MSRRWSSFEKWSTAIAIAAIVAAVLITVFVPEVRVWLHLEKPSVAATKVPKESQPSAAAAATSPPTVSSPPTAKVVQRSSPNVKGNRNVAGNNVSGNKNVVGNNNQVTGPAPTAIAPNGIAITGGNVTNPIVNNYAAPQRHLSPEYMSEASKCLSQRVGILDISATQGNIEAWKYAQDWYTMFHNAGWEIKDNIIHTIIMMNGAPTGTGVAILGTWNDVTKQATYDHESPEGYFVTCLVGKSVPGDTVTVIPYPDMAKDTVRVIVDLQPID